MFAAEDRSLEIEAESTKRRLLIVDDETAILLGFKKLIQTTGVEIDTAETLEDALDLLNRRDYQFVITDLKLGGPSGEDGFEVIRAAKRKKKGAVAILVTGYGTQEIMEKAFSIGVSYYYEKPVSAVALRDVLIKLGI